MSIAFMLLLRLVVVSKNRERGDVALEGVDAADDVALRNAPVLPVVVPRGLGHYLLQEPLGASFVAEDGSVGNDFPQAVAASAMKAVDLVSDHAVDFDGCNF
jgi:hypothetical protein